MVSLRAGATVAFTFLSLLGSSVAAPLFDKLLTLSPDARDILKRASPSAPHFVIYSDSWLNQPPSAKELSGYNVYTLSFLLTSGATDMAKGWEQLPANQRTSILKEYEQAGIHLIVSAFGATEQPTTSGANAVTVGNDLAKWVKQYGLKGIDVDYEDLTAFSGKNGAAEKWLVSLTQTLRKQLPQGEYILSHAPLAPWFSPNRWSGNGYLAVDKAVGSLIDYYNIQFYNQGTTEYTTCKGLLTESSSTWPETALFQIAKNGVEQNKLVIGKPAKASDASNGYVSPQTLAKCVAEAHGKGWNAGVMVWEYPDADSSWMHTVRGKTF